MHSLEEEVVVVKVVVRVVEILVEVVVVEVVVVGVVVCVVEVVVVEVVVCVVEVVVVEVVVLDVRQPMVLPRNWPRGAKAVDLRGRQDLRARGATLG